jgi:hypothetical protein
MKLNRFFLLLVCLLMASSMVIALGCGDDDDDDDDDAVDDDAVDDDDDDDTTGDDDDTTGDDDDDDDDDDDGWVGAQEVIVSTPEGDVTIALAGMATAEYTDPDTSDVYVGVSIAEVVDAAVAKAVDPSGYKFNFIASDGYNVLTKKLDGDFRGLPAYDDLDLGYFVLCGEGCDAPDDIMAVWDESLAFPSFLSAKYMDGGTMGLVEEVLFDESCSITVEYGTLTKQKAVVDLMGLPAFTDDDGDLSVAIHHVILEAALEEFDPKTFTYVFNFIAEDGYDLLEHIEGYGDTVEDLPLWLDYEDGKDVHNGWIKNTTEDGFRAFWAESTGFPGSYGVGLLDGGTIEAYDITAPVK